MDIGAVARELALRLNPRVDDGCSRRYLRHLVETRGWSRTLRYPTARAFVDELEAGLRELQCGS